MNYQEKIIRDCKPVKLKNRKTSLYVYCHTCKTTTEVSADCANTVAKRILLSHRADRAKMMPFLVIIDKFVACCERPNVFFTLREPASALLTKDDFENTLFTKIFLSGEEINFDFGVNKEDGRSL